MGNNLVVKKLMAFIFALILIIGFYPAHSETNPKFGEPCPTLNLKKTFEYINYICLKVNGELVWTGEQYGGEGTNEQASTTSESSSNSNKSKITNKVPSIKFGKPKINVKCDGLSSKGIKIKDGILYCVPISDGSFKYIEKFSKQPKIVNPTNSEDLNNCRPPDLRGQIPQGWDPGAITYPIKNHALINNGVMNFAVVPIDFSDLRGTGLPSSIYAEEMSKMSKWFDFFSNGKLKIQFQMDDKWHRAPNPSSHYDVGEGVDISAEGLSTRQLMQEYVEVTKSNFDFSKADSILFIYPKTISTITKPVTRYSGLNVNGEDKGVMLMATSLQNYSDNGPLWLWTAHEMLHHMGLVQHFPVNPPDWGVEWGGYTHSEVLLPWNQSTLDWLKSDQYYCVTAENLTNQKLTLVPLEQSISGMRTVFIRVSNSEVLMVNSHRKGMWSYDLPDSYYGTMVALIDTSKQTDRTGEASGDWQDGVKYSKSGVYLHPSNNVIAAREHVWNQKGAGEWGSLMYLGDSITYKGVTIKLVSANNFDTIEITKV